MMPVLKNLPADAADVRDTGSILGLGRSPGGGHGNPVSIPVWRIPRTEESWGGGEATVHRVTESDVAEAPVHTCTHICIFITESLCYTSETNMTL